MGGRPDGDCGGVGGAGEQEGEGGAEQGVKVGGVRFESEHTVDVGQGVRETQAGVLHGGGVGLGEGHGEDGGAGVLWQSGHG